MSQLSVFGYCVCERVVVASGVCAAFQTSEHFGAFQ